MFAALGIFHPYLTLTLKARGLDPGEVALLATVFPVIRLFAPSAWGWLADRRRDRVGCMRGVGLLAVLAAVGLGVARGYEAHLLAMVLLGVVYSPLFSLLDAVALEEVALAGVDWGRVRIAGSLGFLVACGGGGLVWEEIGVARAPYGLALALLGTWGLLFWLPRHPPATSTSDAAPWREVREEVLHGPFLALCAVGTLHYLAQSGHDLYFAVYMDDHGHSTRLTGLAWSFGVACEMVVLAHAGALARRFGVRNLVLAGIAAGVLRFAAMAFARGPAALVGIQALHALSFGAWFYGSVQMVDRLTPPRLRATAQGFFGASLFGVGVGAAAYCWGTLLERAGSGELYGYLAVTEAAALVTALVILPAPPRPTGPPRPEGATPPAPGSEP